MNENRAAADLGQICFELDGDGCIFFVKGELDHHSVREIRERIDGVLVDHRPKRVVMDLSGVTFTDSAGLGLILGRYTRINGYGGELLLTRVPEQFMRILSLSGALRFIKAEGSGRACEKRKI